MAVEVVVTGSITDPTGAGDGAYNLCGRRSVEEFVNELRETLLGSWGLVSGGRNGRTVTHCTLTLEIKRGEEWGGPDDEDAITPGSDMGGDLVPTGDQDHDDDDRRAFREELNRRPLPSGY